MHAHEPREAHEAHEPHEAHEAHEPHETHEVHEALETHIVSIQHAFALPLLGNSEFYSEYTKSFDQDCILSTF